MYNKPIPQHLYLIHFELYTTYDCFFFLIGTFLIFSLDQFFHKCSISGWTPHPRVFAIIIHNVELAGQPSTRPFARFVQRSGSKATGKVLELGGCLKGLENTRSSNSDSKLIKSSFKMYQKMCVENKTNLPRYSSWMMNNLVIFVPSHRIHVWYIYLHLVDFYGKCRQIYQSHGSYGHDFRGCSAGVLPTTGLAPPILASCAAKLRFLRRYESHQRPDIVKKDSRCFFLRQFCIYIYIYNSYIIHI